MGAVVQSVRETSERVLDVQAQTHTMSSLHGTQQDKIWRQWCRASSVECWRTLTTCCTVSTDCVLKLSKNLPSRKQQCIQTNATWWPLLLSCVLMLRVWALL